MQRALRFVDVTQRVSTSPPVPDLDGVIGISSSAHQLRGEFRVVVKTSDFALMRLPRGIDCMVRGFARILRDENACRFVLQAANASSKCYLVCELVGCSADSNYNMSQKTHACILS